MKMIRGTSVQTILLLASIARALLVPAPTAQLVLVVLVVQQTRTPEMYPTRALLKPIVARIMNLQAITVEAITVEAITVAAITVEAITVAA